MLDAPWSAACSLCYHYCTNMIGHGDGTGCSRKRNWWMLDVIHAMIVDMWCNGCTLLHTKLVHHCHVMFVCDLMNLMSTWWSNLSVPVLSKLCACTNTLPEPWTMSDHNFKHNFAHSDMLLCWCAHSGSASLCLPLLHYRSHCWWNETYQLSSSQLSTDSLNQPIKCCTPDLLLVYQPHHNTFTITANVNAHCSTINHTTNWPLYYDDAYDFLLLLSLILYAHHPNCGAPM